MTRALSLAAFGLQTKGAAILKEQVMARKVGERGGMYGKRQGAQSQRPARRGSRGESQASFSERMRALSHYLPFFGKVVLAIAVAGLSFAGYRAAASASFFQVRQVDVRGTSRASTEQIQQVVRGAVAESGVWRADLTALRRQLEHLPWVRTAIVSRLLPDGFRVRITERVPRAVVRNAAGRFVWVDDDGVILSEMAPTDQAPAFFLRGWNEDGSAEAAEENRERIREYLQVAQEWDAAGLSARVSELNLLDLHDVRAQLTGDDSQVEIRLGAEELGPRLGKALRVLDEQRKTPLGPYITYLIMSQKNPIVGHSAGAQALEPRPSEAAEKPAVKTSSRTDPAAKAQKQLETARPNPALDETRPEQGAESRKRRVNETRSRNNR